MTTRKTAVGHRIAWIAVPFLLLLTLVAWAFASPLGASPDDDFHMPSIWCGLGERPGMCEMTDDTLTRVVPASLTNASCFAFHPDQSADCWDPSLVSLVETERLNTGQYPAVFYATMGLFASDDVQTSVLLMRIFNAALAVGVITAVFWALPRRLRAVPVAAALGASVPLGLFIIPSVNPSSWAFLSAVTVFASLLGAVESTGRRRWVLSALALVGALIGAGARADAAAYTVLAILVVAVMGARLQRRLLIPAVTAVLICVLSLVLYLSASQGGALISGLPGITEPLTVGDLVANLLNIPSLWSGALGGWSLGWLDTPLPSVVEFFSLVVAGGVIFVGTRSVSLRRWLAIGIAGGALWLVPFVLLARSNALVGEQIQPRYILPLLVLFLAAVSAADGGWRWWRGPRLAIAAALLAVAGSVALHTNIRRYTTGLDDMAIDPGSQSEWWWTNIPPAGVVWAIGSISFAGALALLCFVSWRAGVTAGAGDGGGADISSDDSVEPGRDGSPTPPTENLLSGTGGAASRNPPTKPPSDPLQV